MAFLNLGLNLSKTIALLAIVAAPLAAQTEPIKLKVDASEATRRLLHATMQFPVKPGPFSLLYPKWIPGEHGPTGPIEDLVGIKITAGGKTIPWQRDPVNMFEFHVDVPQGVSELDVAIDFISPPESGAFSSGPSITTELAVLSWNHVLLYPKGTPSDQLRYQATLQVPKGWRYGTALPIQSESGNQIVFQPASLTTLIDSPVQTGAFFNTVDLNPGGSVGHYLHVAADSKRATELNEAQIQQYRQLVTEANSLFGAHHYRDYHFLYTLSDHVAHFGLEHHESSDDRMDERSLIDEDLRKTSFFLLPHEMVHSWNGKYRRPAGLATPDYNEPMKGNLLWVYEGLTNYLGEVLGVRSGLAGTQVYLDNLAMTAASLNTKQGRAWRPLEDTATAAQTLYTARNDYSDYRRSVDYYPEGSLIWLEADVTIRKLSKNKKSLDDFCKVFYGGPSGAPEVKPYTFEDVVAALNSVEPFDWADFLRMRVQSVEPHAPLGGITGGGYKLVFSSERSDFQKTTEGVRKYLDLSYSVGLVLRDNGDISDVRVGSPAFRAGIAPSGKVIAINQRAFTADLMRETLQAKDPKPLQLLVKDGDYFRTFSIDYHDGERYPHLVRENGQPDVISAILRPRAPRKQ